MDKLATVNAAIALFAPGTIVRKSDRGWFVEWHDYHGKKYVRRWCTANGSDTLPAWHHVWAQGGTSCNALAQLMRWLQNRPVFGLTTWQYWCGDSIKLAGPQLLDILRSGGWPEDQICVICNAAIDCRKMGLDWWSLHGKSGPCCRSVDCRNSNRGGDRDAP